MVRTHLLWLSISQVLAYLMYLSYFGMCQVLKNCYHSMRISWHGSCDAIEPRLQLPFASLSQCCRL